MSSDIIIERLGKTFNSTGRAPAVRIFDGLNLHIEAGQLIALVGPSGCGKSTLLNLIAGLEKPSHGEIRFDPRADLQAEAARAGAGISARERLPVKTETDLSVVFQQPRLLDWLTVEENVAIAFDRAGKVSGERARITQELLTKVGLAQHAKTYPQFLSGGQKQRVAIARAFAVHPDVLLLDEPFSALDELTARRLRLLLQDMWISEEAQRPTGVLVTHNMLEAAFLSDRIYVIGRQSGQFTATIDVDLPRPRNPDDPALFEIHRRTMQALD
ncbi:MAG: ABC transporter ATP-binding protein [Janthinobacterium lividum]